MVAAAKDGAYDVSRPYAFTFWESAGETPGYIELCLRSQQRNLAETFHHVHLDLEAAREWVPEYDELWEMSVPAHEGKSASRETRRLAIFTGMLRVALIQRHGGLWVDADTLLFPQFALLSQIVTEFDLVCGESASGGLGNAVLGGRPGSTFFDRYLAAVRARIADKRASGDLAAVWGEFGFHMVRGVFLEQDPHRSWVAPWGVLNTIDPVLERPTFTEGLTVAEALSPTALDVSVFSNGVDGRDRQLSAGDLERGNTLFANAYRIAMGQDDTPHLSVRDVAQLRALNRATLMHRAAGSGDERARAVEQTLRAKLRKSRAEHEKTRARLEQHEADAEHLRSRVAELERPFPHVRKLVRRVRP